MPQFHETQYGRRFFEGQLPQLIKGVEKLGRELERFNQTVNSIDIIEKIVDKKIDEVLDRSREIATPDLIAGGDLS
jgi:hypothetical protein